MGSSTIDGIKLMHGCMSRMRSSYVVHRMDLLREQDARLLQHLNNWWQLFPSNVRPTMRRHHEIEERK